jgi:hypothetical protein
MSKRSVESRIVGAPRAEMHQLVHARAMRQRRHHQRGIGLGGARHEIAEMVGDDETHLAMGQHGGLGTPGRARGEEEPAGIVMLDAASAAAMASTRRSSSAQVKVSSPRTKPISAPYRRAV